LRQDAAQKYRSQQIITASPAKVVAMLYDRAVRALHDAIAAIEAGDIESRWRHNNMAIEIVTQLAMHLDMERGGKIAENLDSLYRFALRRLPDVDLYNDPVPAREVIGILDPLRQSWHELAKQNAQIPSSPEGPEDKPTDPAGGKRVTVSA